MTIPMLIGESMIQYCSIKRRTRVFGNVHVRIELLKRKILHVEIKKKKKKEKHCSLVLIHFNNYESLC